MTILFLRDLSYQCNSTVSPGQIGHSFCTDKAVFVNRWSPYKGNFLHGVQCIMFASGKKWPFMRDWSLYRDGYNIVDQTANSVLDTSKLKIEPVLSCLEQ